MAIRPYLKKMPKIDRTAYVEESAEIIGDVRIGKNSSIWNCAVLRGDMHYIRISEYPNPP